MSRNNQEPHSASRPSFLSQRPADRGEWTKRLPCCLGFGAVAIMLTMLYVLSTQQAWFSRPVGGILVGLLLAAVVAALVQESRTLMRIEARPLLSKPALLDFAGVVGGALITYVVSNDLGLGAVTASGLIGLLGALIFPAQAVPIYCGSFVGMSSPALLTGYHEILLAGAAAGVVYDLAAGTLDGFGGKLGTIAFAGAVITGIVLKREFAVAEVPAPPLAWQIIVFATAAAVLTYWLSVQLGHGPVVGSSVVGLVGGLLLPALAPEAGSLLAVVVICSSFTGMSGPSRVPNLLWMTPGGLVTGVIFVYSLPVLGGAGGKLGTIALGASMVTWTLHTLLVGAAPDAVSDARSQST